MKAITLAFITSLIAAIAACGTDGSESFAPPPARATIIPLFPATPTPQPTASRTATAAPTSTPVGASTRQPSDPTRELPSSSETTAALRHLALTSDPPEIGIDETDGVWAVILDTTFEDGNWFSVVAIIDGNASIYFSTGGGIIGDFAHETVRLVAQNSVKIGEQIRDTFELSQPLEPPRPGYTRLFIRHSNILSASVEIMDTQISEEMHPLSDLYFAMNDVITELRLTSVM